MEPAETPMAEKKKEQKTVKYNMTKLSAPKVSLIAGILAASVPWFLILLIFAVGDLFYRSMTFGSILGFFASFTAIIVGVIGLKKHKNSGRTMSSAGLLLGILGLLTFYIFLPIDSFGHTILNYDNEAKNTIRDLVTKNEIFKADKIAESGKPDTKYSGYARQLSDLKLVLEKQEDKSSGLYVAAGKKGETRGYCIQYTPVMNKAGEVVSYVICAWPETIGKSGTKYFIATSILKENYFYEKEANDSLKMPITKWPDNKTLESEWIWIN